MGSRKRGALRLLLVPAAALLALVVWLSLDDDRDRAIEPSGAEAPVVLSPEEVEALRIEHDGGVSPARDGGRATLADRERMTREAERPLEGDIPDEAIDPGPGSDYMQRYGGRSGRLSPHEQPSFAAPSTANESLSREPPFLVAWVPTVRIQNGRSAPIRAVLRDASGRVIPDRIIAVVRPVGRAQPRQSIDMTSVAPAGDEYDFETTFTADARQWPEPPHGEALTLEYRVIAEGTYQGQAYVRHAGGLLFVQAPRGSLLPQTARIRRTTEGIVLEVVAVIEREGDYWAYADLWGGPDGTEPIAFGRIRLESLPPGRHTVQLLFGGAIIADSGIDGPYTIRTLRFMQVDAVPPHEQEPIPVVGQTPPWTAASFRG